MTSVRVPVPAKQGPGGVIMWVTLSLQKGAGKVILENVTNITEENRGSIQRVVAWAEHLTGKGLKNDQNLVINCEKVQDSIKGTSWELPLALGLISLLSGVPLRDGLTGTGAIGKDGIITPVGYVPEKVRAARDAGYSLFLVSSDQPRESIEAGGMHIIPVRTLQDAWNIARPWSPIQNPPLANKGAGKN